MVQIHPDPPDFIGGVAQLGERLLCKQEVIGSIPFTSTKILSVNAMPRCTKFDFRVVKQSQSHVSVRRLFLVF